MNVAEIARSGRSSPMRFTLWCTRPPLRSTFLNSRFHGCTRYAKIDPIMITTESVEKACSQVGEYSDETMAGEFERFFKEQPAICDFVVELTHDSGQQIQELSLFLSYMVFKALEVGSTGAVTSVTRENIEAAYRDSESWIDRMSQAEGPELQSELASSFNRDTEPFLLQYVISELNEPMEDGTELDDNGKGEVFFLLKTVIASLSNNKENTIGFE
jgi:hypothetical protein